MKERRNIRIKYSAEEKIRLVLEGLRREESTAPICRRKIYIPKEEKPRLLSDNGACYIHNKFQSYLNSNDMGHVRGKPYHPQTQGKIERYHRSMKNVLLLDNYYSPEELKKQIGKWVYYYNNQRYHESLNNVMPADRYYGRKKAIIRRREVIKEETILMRRQEYQRSLQTGANCL